MRVLISQLALILMIMGSAGFGVAAPETAAEKKPCCFSNPRFSGQCKVTPGPDETCSEILTYLNAQNSVGKAYCGNTTIRGGWTSVTCEETKSAGELQTVQCSDRAVQPVPRQSNVQEKNR